MVKKWNKEKHRHTQTKNISEICINQIEREREEANEVRYKSIEIDIKTEETKTNIMRLLH